MESEFLKLNSELEIEFNIEEIGQKYQQIEQQNNTKVQRTYEKPLFEEQKGLIFSEQILELYNNGRFCVQCSSCHGCR